MHEADSTLQKSQVIMNPGGILILQDIDVNLGDPSDFFT